MMVILSLRSCGKFIEWNPGLTPREHLEMVQSEKMLAMQIERETADRRWREEQAKIEREWKEQDRKYRDDEAEKVELRHQQNYKATERRVWLAGALAIATTITAQIILDRYRAIPPTPTAGAKPAIQATPAPKHPAVQRPSPEIPTN